MRWTAACVLTMLAASALAGCQTDTADFSRESLIIHVNASDGPVVVGIPLWLAAEGATAEQWLDAFVVHQGAADLTVRETAAGPALWAVAPGSFTAEVQDLRSVETGAPPRAYLDGGSSLGTGPRDAPLAWQENGTFDLVWTYEGQSDGGCHLTINQIWVAPQGLALAERRFNGGLPPEPWCAQ